jgi:predicted amidophosphoribosyltransferase
MIAMYCRDHHGAQADLCGECAALREYAAARLDKCVYGAAKPVCNRCPIHCYRKSMREQMRAVMRYSGPRMILAHPVMALRHVLDARRKAPDKPPATP